MTTTIPAGWKITAGTGAAGDYIDIVPPEGERHDARIYRGALHPGPAIYRLASALLDAQQAEPLADALVRRYISAVIADDRDAAADATRAMVDYATGPAAPQAEPVAFYVYEWINDTGGIFRSFRPSEHQFGRSPDRVIAVPAPQPAEPVNVELLRRLEAVTDALAARLGTNAEERPIVDAARASIARAEAAKLKPEPLTDVQIMNAHMSDPMSDHLPSFMAGVRFAERAHGITGDNK